MKGYPILNEISKQEILKVIEQAGSVKEAAKSLDIGLTSIYRLTTPEERRGLTRRRRTYAPSLMHPEQEEIPACLKVEPSAIRLTGAFGQYEIGDDSTVIAVEIHHEEIDAYFDIPKSQLSAFIRELQAIERNIDKAKPKLEVW